MSNSSADLHPRSKKDETGAAMPDKTVAGRMPVSEQPIMVATDLSSGTDRVLTRALIEAEHVGSSLFLLHILQDKAATKTGLVPREAYHRISEKLPDTDVEIELRIDMGPVGERVLELARRERCQMIMTGMAHHDGIGPILSGSPVDHIVSNSHVPVLIVKKLAVDPYHQLLVTTDFSTCSLYALQRAAMLFPAASIRLIHAYRSRYGGWLKSGQKDRDGKMDAARRMERFLAKTSLENSVFERIEPVCREGEPVQVIAEELAASEADLVVLGTHGRTGFRAAIMGSVAQAMLGRIEGDMLMVRELL